jgi:hypothetical protein
MVFDTQGRQGACMRAEAVVDHYLFTGCANWGAFKCPHRDSVVLLLATINDDKTVLLRDRLVQDLNGLCGHCRQFNPLRSLEQN